jgi:hypothetical protein
MQDQLQQGFAGRRAVTRLLRLARRDDVTRDGNSYHWRLPCQGPLQVGGCILFGKRHNEIVMQTRTGLLRPESIVSGAVIRSIKCSCIR